MTLSFSRSIHWATYHAKTSHTARLNVNFSYYLQNGLMVVSYPSYDQHQHHEKETLVHVFYSIKRKHSSMHHEISSTKLSRSINKLLQTVSQYLLLANNLACMMKILKLPTCRSYIPFVAKNEVHVPKSTQPYGKLPKGKQNCCFYLSQQLTHQPTQMLVLWQILLMHIFLNLKRYTHFDAMNDLNLELEFPSIIQLNVIGQCNTINIKKQIMKYYPCHHNLIKDTNSSNSYIYHSLSIYCATLQACKVMKPTTHLVTCSKLGICFRH